MAATSRLTRSDKPFALQTLLRQDKLGRGLLGDVCGTSYAAKGSVWHYGLGGSRLATSEPSMMGVFDNDYGDSITVVWSHTTQFNNLTMLGEGSRKVYDWLWFFAEDVNSNHTTEYYRKAQRICNKQRRVDYISMRTTGTAWADDAANAFQKKLGWLLQSIADVHGSEGRKPLKILVVLHKARVWTPKTVFAEVVTYTEYIQLAAGIASVAIPAIPVGVIKKAVNVLTTFRDKGTVDSNVLIEAATTLVPESLRKSEYVQKAQKIYNYASQNQYAAAAKEIGIDVPGALESFKRTCDWTLIAKNAKSGFDTAISTLQNTVNADVISKFAKKLQTGSFASDLIENGTITGFKEFQDAILGGISPSAIMTMLPDPPGIVQKIIQETNDITNNDEFRAFLGLANGYSIGDNVLDELGIRAISSRVNTIIADRTQAGDKNREYALTTAIDKDKREYIAKQVAGNVQGAKILTNPGDVARSSNFRKAAPYIVVGGAAVGAAYFYSRR